MASDLRCDDAVLLVGDQDFSVEVDLGLFLPDTGVWGGVLRCVPESLAGAVRNMHDLRLCLSSGQERQIRPFPAVLDETWIPFMGGRVGAVLLRGGSRHRPCVNRQADGRS
jgi:hypothetical protein